FTSFVFSIEFIISFFNSPIESPIFSKYSDLFFTITLLLKNNRLPPFTIFKLLSATKLMFFAFVCHALDEFENLIVFNIEN
ncbi:hypothetical protein QRX06_20225, partial [Clostridioides difficile]|nr:hypothetical protein [Clostridioides difficile]